MTKILVTGYGGFLGAEISRQLLAAGYEVVGVARGRYPELESLGLQALQADIANRKLVMDVSNGCDAIVHTAAKAGVWGPWREYYRINTLATSHLLEAAHRSSVRALVYTSSPSVTFNGQNQSNVDERVPYPEKWLCYYPQTKALAEQAVLAASEVGKVATCALRPHLIWGLGDPHLFPRVIERALAGKLRRVGSGKNLIDVVHVASAAQAHVAAVGKLLDGDSELNGQAMFLTDGKPVECWSWITRILEGAGIAVPTKSISFNAAFRLGVALETIYAGLRLKHEPPMTRFVAAQLALDHYFSIEKANKLLAYNPDVNVDEQFERFRPWLRQLAAGR